MNLRRMLGLVVAAVGAAGLARAADPPRTLKVGDRLEYVYAGSWYKATVLEVGQGKNAGSYKVKTDASGDSWVKSDRIKWQERTPPTLEAKDAFGVWEGLATVVRTEDVDKSRAVKITETGLRYIPNSLTINADGTYAWVVGTDRLIQGKWDREPKPQRYRGPVILRQGLFGNDWWVNNEGTDEHGTESIYIRSQLGTRYWATRAPAPAKADGGRK